MVLPYSTYKDKVLAGWIGKSIGGVIGARLECHKQFKPLSIDELWPAELMPNDDLDLQVLWLEAMQERGLYFTSDDLVEMWRDRCWYPFCEYGVMLNNVQRGIAPPLSGTWNNGFFKHSEGCPIRAEIWGYVAAGNPALAAELAQLDGQLDHGVISIQAEQFYAAAAAQAVIGGDLDAALAAGASVLPVDSPIMGVEPRVRELARQYPNEHQAWRAVIREFGDRNANDAIANHALTLLALFLGGGDLKRTMQLCANFCWDTDCTASTAGILLATISGTASLPQDWVERLGKTLLCGIAVKHQGAPLSNFAEDTCRIGVEMSLTRNPAVEFLDAPTVTVRPAPAPAICLAVDYHGEPVLWNAQESSVAITIANPFPEPRRGKLIIEGEDGLDCRWDTGEISLPPQGQIQQTVTISSAAHSGWIADKNLLRATWIENGTRIAHRSFGLGGARQWQVYGPYWDMWDKTRFETCPYDNEEKVGGPFVAGLTGDCYNHYARLEAAYLDEERLCREDIPEEIPLPLQHGEDHLTAADFGGFRGQACYYLVRTFRSKTDREAALVLGRTGPYRAWLDGVELGQSDTIRGWATLDDANLNIRLTGEPQRLVIKLIRLTDEFDFSLMCMGQPQPSEYVGVSNILDCLEDKSVG